MSAVSTLAPPAQVVPSAAAELLALPRDILLIGAVVNTLMQVRTDPTNVGVPLGPSENIYYARCDHSGYIVLYTVDHQRSATIYSVRKAVGV